MELKITTLIENNSDDKGQLLYEHGLSLYIETDGKNILFDTGESGDFIKNAKSLNKNLNILDYCIISHGHYDHSGGLKKLVELLKEFPQIIVGAEFFKPKYKMVDEKTYKYNGNPFYEEFILDRSIPIKKVEEDFFYLTDNIMIFHHFKRTNDFEKRNEKFYIMEKNLSIHDDFDDEIVLGIVTDKGLVVIVGCSHVGIVNILKTISQRVNIPIHAVIGGTHLIEADEFRMKKTIDAFKEMKIQLIAVSHCTGEEGIRFIREELKEQFLYNNTGKVIEI